jgi:hypothetical protein
LRIASKLQHPLLNGLAEIDGTLPIADVNNALVQRLSQNITSDNFELWFTLVEAERQPLLLAAGILALLKRQVAEAEWSRVVPFLIESIRRLPADTTTVEDLNLEQPFPLLSSRSTFGAFLITALAQLLQKGPFRTADATAMIERSDMASKFLLGSLELALSVPFYRAISGLLKAIFGNLGELQLRCLALIWSETRNAAGLRARALSLASAYVASHPAFNYTPLLPFLLLELGDSALPIRRAAIRCFVQLPGTLGKKELSFGSAAAQLKLPEDAHKFLQQQIRENAVLFENDPATLHRFIREDEVPELSEFMWSSACVLQLSRLVEQLDRVPLTAPVVSIVVQYLTRLLDQQPTTHSRVLLASLVHLPQKLINSKPVVDVFSLLLNIRDSPERAAHSINFIGLLEAEITQQLNKASLTSLTKGLLQLFVSPLPQVRTALNLTLPSLPLPANILYEMLSPAEPPVSNRAKKPKLSADEPAEARLSQLNATLELLLMREIPATSEFFVHLFDALTRLLETEEEAEYSKQLTLSLLTQWVEEHGVKVVADLRKLLKMDSILQAIRTSTSPQTQNNALQFVAAVAQHLPDQMFEYTLPLFTFLGTNTARQDDAQSAKVMLKTIQAVLPPLVQRDGTKGFLSVLYVLTEAYDTIPPQRQLDLLQALLTTVGTDYLPTLLFIFMARGRSTEFPRLLTQFTPSVVLATFSQLLLWVTALPELKGSDIRQALKDLELSPSQVQELEKGLLQLISDFLLNPAFLETLVSVDPQILQDAYVHLFKNTLVLVTARSLQIVDRTFKKVRSHLKAVVSLAYELSSTLNGLLDLPTFVNLVTKLLHHEDPQIRRRSLQLFNDKITEERGRLTAEQVTQLVGLGPGLIEVIQGPGTEAELVLNKQTALLSLEILVRHFSASAPATFVEFLSQVCSVLEKETSPILISTCLITCTSFMAELGVKVLPLLSRIVPLLFVHLEATFKKKSNIDPELKRLLQVSSFSSLQVLVRTLNRFLSPYLGRLFSAIIQPALIDAASDVHTKVVGLIEAAAEHIGARLVVPALLPLYKTAGATTSPLLQSWLFLVLQRLGEVMLAREFAHQHKTVFEFFTTAFEFRSSNTASDEPTVDFVEGSMLDALMPWVLKCGEGEFKPLFHGLAYWAAEGDDINRSLVFYKWVNRLAQSLQSLFVPYYAFVFDSALELLARCTARGFNESKSKNKKKRKQAELDEATLLRQRLCVVELVSSFSVSFEYDATNFFTDEVRCAKLTEALVSQVPRASPSVRKSAIRP